LITSISAPKFPAFKPLPSIAPYSSPAMGAHRILSDAWQKLWPLRLKCIRNTFTSMPAQRSSWRRSNFRCATFRSVVVWRAKRSQQRDRVRDAPQPFTRCCDSRLRSGGQCDRNARAQGRVQRAVKFLLPIAAYPRRLLRLVAFVMRFAPSIGP
jgi:hypothetical protein